jgi:predicted AAA+ superfamily ATPase
MIRDFLQELINWKAQTNRKPILLRGARQVGKTWLIEHFGKTSFSKTLTINFELQPQFKSCFDIPHPDEIIRQIELTANINLTNPDILLFFDEVQQCPKALVSLRYFYEIKPQMAIIAAGSLLEFIKESDNLSIPVGRILTYYLGPLSFGEFLSACGEFKLREYLKNLSIIDSVPESIHGKAISLLRSYLYTGGMPAAIKDWIESNTFNSTDLLHRSLLQTYRQDFGKYGRRVNTDLLETLFMKIPGTVGSRFKYSSIQKDIHSREIKKGLLLLIKARIVTKIESTSAKALPLNAHTDESKFKVLFLDVGLFQNSMGISSQTYLAPDLLAVYRGAVTEQYAGQQLLSLLKFYEDPQLFFWRRDVPGSEAEVDYIYQHGEIIFPVEVKSGTTGSLKSLNVFLSENAAPFGIRLSMQNISFYNKVLSIPLYAIESLPSLVTQALAKK